MAGSIADFNKRIAETKTRLAAEKKSSSGSSSKDVVVDPKTGRTWGSVEEYVTDPRKYGGGGGSSGRSFKEEFARRQASKAAEQVAAQKAVELKAQQQAAAEQQKESIQQRIIIKASGGVKVGDIRYVGNAIVPDTGGLTANQYRRKIRQQAIEEGIIDQKDYGKATLEINRQKEKVKEDKSSRVIETPPQSITAQLPGGELPQYNNFIVGDDIFGTRTDLGEANKVPSTPIYQEGTIFKVQTGSTPFEGYSVPTFEYQTMGENTISTSN